MRADLHTMEQIDLYLQGKLTGAELHRFENLMASDPALKSMVSDQQLLIQTVNRKALLAEIHAVAGIGGTPWYANPVVAVAGATLVVGGILATVYFMSAEAAPETPVVSNHQTIQPELPQMTEAVYNDEDVLHHDTAATHKSRHNRVYTYTDPAGSMEEEFTETDEQVNSHVSTINNQADQLSQQTDNGMKVVVESDEREEAADHSSVTKKRMAAFPQGDMALQEFIRENMRFPGTAREKKISGNVKVKFLVTPEGTRTNIEASCFNLRDENDKPLTATQVMLNKRTANLFEREAERIVRIMPVWIPATDSQGNAVLSAVELYFNFSLKEGNSVYVVD